MGEGFFGRVFLAEDTVLPRRVAIKELKEDFLGDKRTLRRFLNDARAAAALQHVNIVNVYDIVPLEDPQWLILEWLGGGSLRDLLRTARRPPIDKAIQVGTDICRALEVANRHGIVHRDIKPENVMFSDTGVLKVCDFGIAHLPPRFDPYVSVYRSGEAHPGTPIYESPEQVNGGELDGRSDLYTVGVVLYEILTGEHYFDYRGQRLGDVRRAVLDAQPEPPSRRNPAVPSRLDGIVLQLLAKSPTDRFSSAGEVVIALEEVYQAVPREGTAPSPRMIGLECTCRREGDRFRFCIRVEAINLGKVEAEWGGITVSVTSVSSREILGSVEIRAWNAASQPAALYAPGDSIWGFESSSAMTEMRARHLLIESTEPAWKPGSHVSMDVVVAGPFARLEATARVWASWRRPDGSLGPDGDPPWSKSGFRDQQGIPAYQILLGCD